MTRYYFRGTIILETPLHIGSGLSHNTTDSPVRTGVNGLPIIPGTALGGILRAQAERFAPSLEGGSECLGPGSKDDERCLCLCCELFGAINPTGEETRQARLIIRDAPLLSESISLELRDGIGISRQKQTVAGRLKFDWQIVPRFAHFAFETTLETDKTNLVQLFCAVLAEFVTGRITLGGKSGRGMGRVRLDLEPIGEVSFKEDGLNDLKRFLMASREERPKLFATESSGVDYLQNSLENLKLRTSETRPNFIELELALEFNYGLLINNPAVALLEGGDNAFVRTCLDSAGRETLFLPGSSLRGMLRNQAERITRTLSYANSRINEADNFAELPQHDYLTYYSKVTACDPVAGENEQEPDGEEYASIACANYLDQAMPEILKELKSQDKKVPVSRADYLYQETIKCSCLACQLFGNSYLAGRLKISDAFPLEPAGLDPDSKKTRHRLDFVAIDRFTGGARKEAKFEAYPHFPEQGHKLVFLTKLTLVDLNLIEDGWILGWLAFLIRDLIIGDLRLGMGKTKGLGQVKGQLVRIKTGNLQPGTGWLSADPLSPSWQEEESPGLLKILSLSLEKSLSELEPEQNLLTRFATLFNEKVNNFERRRAWEGSV